MAKKTFWKKFKGVASWAKVYEPDEYGPNKFWKVSLHLPQSVIKSLKDYGFQGEVKPSKIEGIPDDYVVFRRNTKANFKGKTEFFAPPKILDQNGKVLVEYMKEIDGSFSQIGDTIYIGNGSVVEVNVEFYNTSHFGMGCRLHEVKILELVEWVPEEDKPEKQTEEPQVEEAPKVEVKEEPKPKKKVSW